MDVITPIQVTPEMISATNVPESDYPEWDSATSYALGDFVISLATHYIYRALSASGPNTSGNAEWDNATDYAIGDQVFVASNLTTYEAVQANGPGSTIQDPATDTNEDYWTVLFTGGGQDPDAEWAKIDDVFDLANTEGIYWDRIYKTNLYRLFDQSPSNPTTNTAVIDITLVPGQFIDAIAFFNVSADDIEVTITNGGTVEYSETFDLVDDSAVVDWWSYFFSPITETTQYLVQDLPPYAAAEINIKVNRPSGVAGCGEIALGPVFDIGLTETKPRVRLFDFSRIEEDQYGNLRVTRRGARKEVTYRFLTPGLRAEGVYNRLEALRGGTQAVWIGDPESRLNLITYGFLDDLDMDQHAQYGTNRAYCLGKIEVKGVV